MVRPILLEPRPAAISEFTDRSEHQERQRKVQFEADEQTNGTSVVDEAPPAAASRRSPSGFEIFHLKKFRNRHEVRRVPCLPRSH